jgi:hypothetical protein
VGGGRKGSAGVAGGSRPEGRHFEREEDKDGGAGESVQLRAVQGRGPGDRIESPYDTEARFRAKSDMTWTGYTAHLTETCDADQPRLVVHADTTAANVHEATRTEPIHAALEAKGLTPSCMRRRGPSRSTLRSRPRA